MRGLRSSRGQCNLQFKTAGVRNYIWKPAAPVDAFRRPLLLIGIILRERAALLKLEIFVEKATNWK